MIKLLSFLFFLTMSILSCQACLNYYYSLDKEGNLHPANELQKTFNKNFNKELNVNKLLKLESKLKKEHSYMLLSDYAISLMKLGKQKEALEILRILYKHYPTEYKIASNLGTAYELNGKVDSALFYIKRGLELNPNDHEGSEWVHVKVLETKQELLKNPSYLTNHTVLQLSEKQKQDSLVRKQIEIQVRERFPFTAAPDFIMASLLIDLGDCYANTASIEYAKALYQIAKEYYRYHSTVIDEKIKTMQKLMHSYESIQPEKDPKKPLAEYDKIGNLNYKQLIEDNDKQHYIVNWGSINMDISSLVSLVDFTKTIQQLKDSAEVYRQQTEELKLIVDSPASSVNKLKIIPDLKNVIAEKGSTWMYILLFVLIVLVGAYLFLKK